MPGLGAGNRPEWMGDDLAVGVMAARNLCVRMGICKPSHSQTVLCHIGMITATSIHIGSCVSIIQLAIAIHK